MRYMETLNKLKQAGSEGVANWELSQISLQYNYELHKLRKMGYNIKKRRVYAGTHATQTYIYWLDDTPPMEPLRVDPTPLQEGSHAVHVELEMK